MFTYRPNCFFLGILLCLSTSLFAKTTANFSPHLPIHIESDRATIAHATQQATHEGNVILKQGNNQVHADQLSVKKDPKGKNTVIKATGSPATFTGTLQNKPEPVYASAKTIYYYPDKQLLVLEGSATLDHKKDKFRGPTLSYHLDTQVISAVQKNNGSGNERPTFTLHPRTS